MFYKISNSKASPSKALHYCNDKAICNDTFNMFCDGKDSTEDKIKEFETLASNNDNMEYNNRKYYHIKISPQENDIDIKTLIDYGKDFLQEKYNNCQATLSIHNDNGRNHLHIILNAVQLDFKKIQDNERDRFDKQVFAMDTLAKKYNMQPTTLEEYMTPSKDRKLQIDFAKDKQGKQSDREQLKDIIYNAMAHNNNIKDFENELKQNGIEIINCKKKGKEEYKYIYNNRHYTTHSLGENYGRQYFIQVIEKKKEQEQASIQPQPTQQTQDNNFDNLIRQYASDYDKEKEKEKKLKELEKELLQTLKDNKLDSKENLKLITDTMNDKKMKLDVKIETITSFISQVAKIIKDMAQQQTKSNNYDRGYR